MIFTIIAYALGSVIIKKSVKWARVINPILLTAAFALERPILPVFTDYYEILSACINMSTCYLIPWFVCETMAARYLSFIISYSALLIQVHYHFKFEVLPGLLISFSIISFIVFIVFSNDLPTALK